MQTPAALTVVSELIREMKLPGFEQAVIEQQTPLQDGLGIDSLHKLILLTRLQERSRFDFSQLGGQGGFEFHTVGDLVDLLVAHG